MNYKKRGCCPTIFLTKNRKNQRLTLFPMENRRGQLNISFGMIFSIILIIVFLGFGFYAITKFIELQESIQVENFLRNFQDDVNKMWKSPQGSRPVEYILPTKITSVCFKNDELQNLEFISNKLVAGKEINNIDIAKITQNENPFCIQNIGGKISLTISKNYGETLVTIAR